MTSQDRDYEDIVRRALHTAAESVEPAGDGLERIRHRLHSPRSAASVLSGFTLWCRLHGIRLLVRLEPATGAARSGRGQMRHWLAGLGPLPGPLLALFGGRRERSGQPGHHHAGHASGGEAGPPERPRAARSPLGPGAAWLRPVLAVSAVVVVVVVGVFALHRAQQNFFTPTNASGSPAGSQQNGASAAPSAYASPGLWSLPIGVQPKPPVTAKSRKKGVTTLLPAVACTPAPSPSPSTASPSASATPTPTPTTTSPTPTPTDTTSPTPTPTDTSSPTASPTGIASTSARTTAVTTTATPGAGGQTVLARCGTGTTGTPKTS